MKIDKIITFDPDPSLKMEILDIFGKTVNKEGCIVEKDNPDQPVFLPNGDTITLNDFAGIIKGNSLHFIKSDIVSLLQLADKLI